MGMNQAGFMTITHTIIQSMVDDSVRGRVAGVYSVHVGGSMAVTNMINAVFADIFGASPVLIVGGLAFTFAMFLGLSSPPLRQLFFFRADPTSPTEANTEASRSNA
jgi:MFS family permease